jgi:hypothetical protein
VTLASSVRLSLLLLLVGCSAPSPAPSAPAAAPATTPATAATAAPAPAALPPAAPSAEPDSGSDSAVGGTDFAAQAAVVFRIAACGGEGPIDPRFDRRIVDDHCRMMRARMQRYHRAWADRARDFIAGLRPADLPARVVYPFGGGDLTSALVTFPDAAEITTISLEAAGDIRTVDQIPHGTLARDLQVIGRDVDRLFRAAHSTTKSLQTASHSTLPGTIVFAMSALAVHGFEPVSLRYFTLEEDGRLHYLDEAELDAAARALAASAAERARERTPSKHYWRMQEAAFANVEIRYRTQGAADAPVRVYRHIVANLDDPHQGEDPRLVRHLEAKGKVAAMTKAASFLLWYDDFSIIRGYLLQHIAWMISDSSGIPPRYASAAGFEQIPYGSFAGPYFIQDPKQVRQELIDLWKKSPRRSLPFRYGYPDAQKQNHLMVTRPRSG